MPNALHLVSRPRRSQALTRLALIVLVAAQLPSDLSATVLVPADFQEMVAGSELVVHGRVIRVRSTVTGDRRTIETMVTVAVQDSLKGAAPETVYFRVPNGQVGRYRRVMVGAPEFTEGEEVVLFLRGRPPIIPFPFGLSQGVYRVERNANGERMVTRPATPDVPGRVVRGDPARRPIALDAFARTVRTIAEGRP